jgi:hypothetical protein
MKRHVLTALALLGLFSVALFTSPQGLPWERAGAPEKGGEAYEKEEEGEGRRYGQPDAYEAYHESIRKPDLPGGDGYDVGYQARALDAALAVSVGKGGATLPWQEHGPGNVAGRARALLVDVRDASGNTWFQGTAGGGVWKTTNGGLMWTNTSGNMPNLSVSTLAQSAAAPSTIYAGTGEGMGNVDAVFGSGIFKSTDGGATWRLLANTANGDFRAVNRLVVSPTNANLLVAATTTGVYRSTDGGETWAYRMGGVFQQVLATADFSALYASSRGNCSVPPSIFKSTDGGATWAMANQGFGQGRRTEIGIAPSDPSRLYASVEGCESSPISKLYVSSDAAASWKEVAVTSAASTRLWLSGQGWYDNAVAVNPFNSDQVYVGGLDLYRGTVSGATGAAPTVALSRMSVWSASATSTTYAHADHHAYVPMVTNPNTQAWKLVISTDGGIFETTAPAGTSMPWVARNNGLNTTQFYGADKKPGAMEFVAGAQDNGSYTSGLDIGAGTAWTRRVGGDGFDAIYTSPTSFMTSLYNNRIWRFSSTVPSGAELNNFADAGTGSFITQIAKVHGDDNRLYVTGPNGVWRSDDFGDSWSVGVFRNRMNGGWDRWGYSSSRMPVTVSLADGRIVWAGARMSSTERRLFVSTDGGATFDTTRISADIFNLAANATSCPNTASARCGAALTGLATHPTQPNTAYALFSVQGYAKVLRTTDLGRTWTNLSGTFATTDAPLSSNGYPNVATYSLMAFPYAPNLLWAGTEIGLFVSENGGQTWAKDQSGLPPVAIWQMRMADNRVVLATHGRGVWSVDMAGHFRGYNTQPFLLPALQEVAQRPSGNLFVRGAIRQSVDSLQVRAGNRVLRRQGATVHGTSVAFDVPAASVPVGPAEVQIVGYKGGQSYSSGIKTVTVLPVQAPVETLSVDFSGSANLQLEGLMLAQPAGFSTAGLHTPHPYGNSSSFTATLLQPVRVSASGMTIRYSDVALVEPCNDGTSYCNGGGLYDYVTLEATSDGVNWTPLTGPYDARGPKFRDGITNTPWLSAYTSNQQGTEVIMTEHVVIPSRYFPAGTVLMLRFRMVSDPSVAGWGWAVDNLRIDAGITSAEGAAAPATLDMLAPYPNPARRAATVAVTLPAPTDVAVRVYDVQGRLVATLADGPLGAGRHDLAFNAGSIAAGVYLVRMEAGGTVRTRSLTVAR